MAVNSEIRMNQPQSSSSPYCSTSNAYGTDYTDLFRYDLLLESFLETDLNQTASTPVSDLNQTQSIPIPDHNSTQSLVVPSSSQPLFSSVARPRPTSALSVTSEGTFLKKKKVNVFLKAYQEKDEECKKLKAVLDLHKSCAKKLEDAEAKTLSVEFLNEQLIAQLKMYSAKKAPTESIAKAVKRLKEANIQIGDLLNSDKRPSLKIKHLNLYQQNVSDFCNKVKELSKLSDYPLLSDIKFKQSSSNAAKTENKDKKSILQDIQDAESSSDTKKEESKDTISFHQVPTVSLLKSNVNKFPESSVLTPPYSDKDSNSDVFTDVNSLKCIRKLLEDHKQEIIQYVDQKIENGNRKIENVDKKIEKCTQSNSEILDLLKNFINSKGIGVDEILQEQHIPPMLSPMPQDFVTTAEKEQHNPNNNTSLKIDFYFHGTQLEIRPTVYTLKVPNSPLSKSDTQVPSYIGSGLAPTLDRVPSSTHSALVDINVMEAEQSTGIVSFSSNDAETKSTSLNASSNCAATVDRKIVDTEQFKGIFSSSSHDDEEPGAPVSVSSPSTSSVDRKVIETEQFKGDDSLSSQVGEDASFSLNLSSSTASVDGNLSSQDCEDTNTALNVLSPTASMDGKTMDSEQFKTIVNLSPPNTALFDRKKEISECKGLDTEPSKSGTKVQIVPQQRKTRTKSVTKKKEGKLNKNITEVTETLSAIPHMEEVPPSSVQTDRKKRGRPKGSKSKKKTSKSSIFDEPSLDEPSLDEPSLDEPSVDGPSVNEIPIIDLTMDEEEAPTIGDKDESIIVDEEKPTIDNEDESVFSTDSISTQEICKPITSASQTFHDLLRKCGKNKTFVLMLSNRDAVMNKTEELEAIEVEGPKATSTPIPPVGSRPTMTVNEQKSKDIQCVSAEAKTPSRTLLEKKPQVSQCIGLGPKIESNSTAPAFIMEGQEEVYNSHTLSSNETEAQSTSLLGGKKRIAHVRGLGPKIASNTTAPEFIMESQKEVYNSHTLSSNEADAQSTSLLGRKKRIAHIEGLGPKTTKDKAPNDFSTYTAPEVNGTINTRPKFENVRRHEAEASSKVSPTKKTRIAKPKPTKINNKSKVLQSLHEAITTSTPLCKKDQVARSNALETKIKQEKLLTNVPSTSAAPKVDGNKLGMNPNVESLNSCTVGVVDSIIIDSSDNESQVASVRSFVDADVEDHLNIMLDTVSKNPTGSKTTKDKAPNDFSTYTAPEVNGTINTRPKFENVRRHEAAASSKVSPTKKTRIAKPKPTNINNKSKVLQSLHEAITTSTPLCKKDQVARSNALETKIKQEKLLTNVPSTSAAPKVDGNKLGMNPNVESLNSCTVGVVDSIIIDSSDNESQVASVRSFVDADVEDHLNIMLDTVSENPTGSKTTKDKPPNDFSTYTAPEVNGTINTRPKFENVRRHEAAASSKVSPTKKTRIAKPKPTKINNKSKVLQSLHEAITTSTPLCKKDQVARSNALETKIKQEKLLTNVPSTSAAPKVDGNKLGMNPNVESLNSCTVGVVDSIIIDSSDNESQVASVRSFVDADVEDHLNIMLDTVSKNPTGPKTTKDKAPNDFSTYTAPEVNGTINTRPKFENVRSHEAATSSKVSPTKKTRIAKPKPTKINNKSKVLQSLHEAITTSTPLCKKDQVARSNALETKIKQEKLLTNVPSTSAAPKVDGNKLGMNPNVESLNSCTVGVVDSIIIDSSDNESQVASVRSFVDSDVEDHLNIMLDTVSENPTGLNNWSKYSVKAAEMYKKPQYARLGWNELETAGDKLPTNVVLSTSTAPEVDHNKLAINPKVQSLKNCEPGTQTTEGSSEKVTQVASCKSLGSLISTSTLPKDIKGTRTRGKLTPIMQKCFIDQLPTDLLNKKVCQTFFNSYEADEPQATGDELPPNVTSTAAPGVINNMPVIDPDLPSLSSYDTRNQSTSSQNEPQDASCRSLEPQAIGDKLPTNVPSTAAPEEGNNKLAVDPNLPSLSSYVAGNRITCSSQNGTQAASCKSLGSAIRTSMPQKMGKRLRTKESLEPQTTGDKLATDVPSTSTAPQVDNNKQVVEWLQSLSSCDAGAQSTAGSSENKTQVADRSLGSSIRSSTPQKIGKGPRTKGDLSTTIRTLMPQKVCKGPRTRGGLEPQTTEDKIPTNVPSTSAAPQVDKNKLVVNPNLQSLNINEVVAQSRAGSSQNVTQVASSKTLGSSIRTSMPQKMGKGRQTKGGLKPQATEDKMPTNDPMTSASKVDNNKLLINPILQNLSSYAPGAQSKACPSQNETQFASCKSLENISAEKVVRNKDDKEDIKRRLHDMFGEFSESEESSLETSNNEGSIIRNPVTRKITKGAQTRGVFRNRGGKTSVVQKTFIGQELPTLLSNEQVCQTMSDSDEADDCQIITSTPYKIAKGPRTRGGIKNRGGQVHVLQKCFVDNELPTLLIDEQSCEKEPENENIMAEKLQGTNAEKGLGNSLHDKLGSFNENGNSSRSAPKLLDSEDGQKQTKEKSLHDLSLSDIRRSQRLAVKESVSYNLSTRSRKLKVDYDTVKTSNRNILSADVKTLIKTEQTEEMEIPLRSNSSLKRSCTSLKKKPTPMPFTCKANGKVVEVLQSELHEAKKARLDLAESPKSEVESYIPSFYKEIDDEIKIKCEKTPFKEEEIENPIHIFKPVDLTRVEMYEGGVNILTQAIELSSRKNKEKKSLLKLRPRIDVETDNCKQILNDLDKTDLPTFLTNFRSFSLQAQSKCLVNQFVQTEKDVAIEVKQFNPKARDLNSILTPAQLANIHFIMKVLLDNNGDHPLLTSLFSEILHRVRSRPTDDERLQISKCIQLAEFLAVLCRKYSRLDIARSFIYEVLYWMKLMSFPLVYSVIKVYPSTIATPNPKGNLIFEAIVHCIMQTPTNIGLVGHKFMMALRRALWSHYNYSIDSETSEKILQRFLNRLTDTDALQAIALICKRETHEWVYKNVVMHLLNLLQHNHVKNEVYANASIRLIGLVTKAFPFVYSEACINSLIETLKGFLFSKSGSILFKEEIALALCHLAKFNYDECAEILFSWKPELVSAEMLRQISVALSSVQPVQYWNNYISERRQKKDTFDLDSVLDENNTVMDTSRTPVTYENLYEADVIMEEF